jgi:uncharacterized membrane protein YccC
MGRHREYQNDADRQSAYRRRLRARLAGQAPVTRASRPRRSSRPARLEAIESEVRSLLGEYEAWLEALPSSLADSDQAAKLAETIEQLAAVAESVAEIDPPRGFGRD